VYVYLNAGLMAGFRNVVPCSRQQIQHTFNLSKQESQLLTYIFLRLATMTDLIDFSSIFKAVCIKASVVKSR
jgi:hypothetical protein